MISRQHYGSLVQSQILSAATNETAGSPLVWRAEMFVKLLPCIELRV